MMFWFMGKIKKNTTSDCIAVFGRMLNAGLTLNKEKCVFAVDKVKYLGHVVDQEGIRADPDKTAAIQEMRPPTNVSELNRFMGMVNQLGKFSQNLAQISRPLRELLSAKSTWVWGPSQEESFSIKAELCARLQNRHDPAIRATAISDD